MDVKNIVFEDDYLWILEHFPASLFVSATLLANVNSSKCLKSSEVFVGTIAFQLNLCEAREIIDQYLKKKWYWG